MTRGQFRNYVHYVYETEGAAWSVSAVNSMTVHVQENDIRITEDLGWFNRWVGEGEQPVQESKEWTLGWGCQPTFYVQKITHRSSYNLSYDPKEVVSTGYKAIRDFEAKAGIDSWNNMGLERILER